MGYSDTFLLLNVQIVILRVSMHCHGCAKKVEKHISKLEGEHIAIFFPNHKCNSVSM